MNYYNEHDKNAAAWLRELIRRGLIPDGTVDERDIQDVRASDLSGFVQCHFFAGIAGWSEALRLAGWPSDRPVWTGSCPCQPFSVAGKGTGTADKRHLWPVFAELIREAKPSVVFGEQVASKAGRSWLAGVFADLEGMGYSRAGADLCAAGIGAPHIRQRLFWVADAERAAGQPGRLADKPGEGDGAQATGPCLESGRCGDTGGMAESKHHGLHRPETNQAITNSDRENGRLHRGSSPDWSDTVTIQCRDNKLRRISPEPALFPLASGLPYRVGKRGSVRAPLLKGSGNAIVPPLAAEFIAAFMES